MTLAAGSGRPLADLASGAGTVPYEISCSVGKRVKRLYRGSETHPRALISAAGEAQVRQPSARDHASRV